MTDLEQLIDAQLKRLPDPAAPETLLPRVMAAVAIAQSVPWYRRAWVKWPLGLQVASAAAVVLVGGAAWWLIPAAHAWLADASASGQPIVSTLVKTAEWLNRVGTACRVVWDAVIQPMAAHFAVLVVVASFLCAAVWAAVNRFVLGEVSSS